MTGWIKSNTVDRYLRPLRDQMIRVVEPGTDLLEVGCGTGDFLIRASPRMRYGLGLDASRRLISYANRRKSQYQIKNIEFQEAYVQPTLDVGRRFDYSVACLFFHIPEWELAVGILHRLGEISDRVLIGAFSAPTTRQQKIMTYLDQRFTSHYPNFKIYAERGYMEGMIENSRLTLVDAYETFDATLTLYELQSAVPDE